MKRRSFFQSSAVAALALTPVGRLLALAPDSPYKGNIGIQLWTLRDALKADPVATLKKVKEAGYAQVEPFGFPNNDAVLAAAKENGLKVNSCHFDQNLVAKPSDAAMSEFRKVLEKAVAQGFTELVIPYLGGEFRDSVDTCKATCANFNKAAELAKKSGIRLAYHNHAFEFKPLAGGKSTYDVFIEEFSPDMQFEVDIFWVKVGGHDPAPLIEKLKGRVSQLHLKDLKDGVKVPSYDGVPKDAFKELGNGVIDMKAVLAAAEKAGVTHCHVEQDQSPDPVESIRTSMGYLDGLA